LQSFLAKEKKSDLLFSELTPEWLSKFDNYLHKLRNERNPEKLLHQNTIQTTFNVFRTLVLRAVEMGYITYDKNPFMLFKYNGVKTQKEKLNEDELSALLALELEEGSLLWHCRNYFFFSFYCAGIRVADLIQLRWCNITSEGRLNYQMDKNHKVRDLVLVEQAKAILRYYAKPQAKKTDYIFPLLDMSKPYTKAITMADKDTLPIELKKLLFSDVSAKTALINKYLKKLANMAGIDKKVSMHISRHSFARLAKVEGTDNLVLQSLLAHSSVAITEGYMGNFDTSTTDKALQNIFNESSSVAQHSEDKLSKLKSLLAELNDDEISSLLASVKK
jgi:site-specific recombinase XerD